MRPYEQTIHHLRYAGVKVAAVLAGMSLAGGCGGRPAAQVDLHANPMPAPLVTGKSIDPQFASRQNVGSLPINMIASPDGKFAISTDQGYRQSLWSIRLADGEGVSHLDFPKSFGTPANGLYYGLAFGPDGTLYAAQGAKDSVLVATLDTEGKLARQGSIKTRRGDFPSGLAVDRNARLYVANNDNHGVDGQPYHLPSSIAVYDTVTKNEIGRFEFTESFGGTPNFPMALAVLNDGSKLYVASQRDSVVYALDTSDPAKPKQIAALSTGSHPVALLLDKSQGRLFVANAQSDTVSIIDTRTDSVTGTVLLRPEIAKDVAGATPTGLALSANEKRLYVTLGDMNAVAIIDIGDHEVDGYLPAGWYPTAVVPSPDGRNLLVANAKGTILRTPNPPATQPVRRQSPLNLLEGNVIAIPLPAKAELAAQTKRVMELDRLTPRHMRAQNPLKAIGLQAGKITHVIYIVKENRTYDQILGDMPQGNGDPSRTLFGRSITPNQHAIADRFVLLDNFYDCGEVSGDGWTWSTQAQANEYTIRNVPYSYSNRGRTYDYEGQVEQFPTAGFPARDPDGKPLSQDPKYKEGAKAIPDVAEAPGGHIWDMVRKQGLLYRNYGFFVSDEVRYDKKIVIPENIPNSIGLQPGGHDLAGISDLDFRGFDLRYPDSEARMILAKQTGDDNYLCPVRAYGKYAMPSRFSEWKREFDQMLARSPDGSSVPAFMTVRFGTDHTMGTNPDQHSPKSMVADNDYAVGQLVQTIASSPIWRSTAIFVVEDDAQDGPDHVDAHRSTCYVISPWIKANSVDHTFQNTVSLIRTMELLLGLPPMCQYDATAEPIRDWDASPSNDAPFEAILPDAKILLDINGVNSPKSPISPEQKAMMDESSKMDFVHADAAPADRLDEIIWKSVKGYDSFMPATPHGPPPLEPRGGKKDDDD